MAQVSSTHWVDWTVNYWAHWQDCRPHGQEDSGWRGSTTLPATATWPPVHASSAPVSRGHASSGHASSGHARGAFSERLSPGSGHVGRFSQPLALSLSLGNDDEDDEDDDDDDDDDEQLMVDIDDVSVSDLSEDGDDSDTEA